MQGGAGNVLDILHHGDQAVVSALGVLAGREADAAVAHDQRGNAVVRRGGTHGIPGGLAVHVRVHVDPARGKQVTGGVDLPRARAFDLAHRDNASGLYRKVAVKRVAARAVHDTCVANQQVVHDFHLRDTGIECT